MVTSRLGGSDLEVSRVGLGCNNFGGRLDSAATRAVVDAALDAGINFLDTADIYGNFGGSERFLGEALAGRRDRVVLATKFGHDMQGANGEGPGGSRDYVRRAIDASLERLRTDSVDLYYYHRPDGVTPIAETVAAMSELVDEGKVRWLGLSNVDAAQIREAVGAAEIVAVQNYYSLMRRDDDADVLPLCRELGIGYIPYFPLESGLLTGKYRRGEPAPEGARLTGSADRLSDERLARVEELEAFAAARGHTLLELAIGGLASIPGVASVIAGATSPEQVRANAAAGSWPLTAGELEQLDAL
ncbi:MAG TPA: aldo/keto reductase [Gaiellaceae bacterium]|nr:aldo/keto reductase [Gaiellaceae bacterium]